MRYGMSVSRMVVVAGLAMGVIGSTAVQAKDVQVKTGQKIAFMGDSITQFGVNGPKGYVNMVISGLAANDIKAECIPAGISGHKSNDMLARLNNDVISKKPDWMTFSCGVNDVWHGENGVPLDKYIENITKIVEQCHDAKIKVMILTSTMIGEDAPNANNQKLIAYNDFLKKLAKDKKLLLADLNGDMQAAIKKAGPDKKGDMLTSDGVHMNDAGNQMMATGVLKAFGLSEAQITKAEKAWAGGEEKK